MVHISSSAQLRLFKLYVQCILYISCRPLFGDDDNVEDTFGFAFAKKKQEEKAKKPEASPVKKADQKKVQSDSEDVSINIHV